MPDSVALELDYERCMCLLLAVRDSLTVTPYRGSAERVAPMLEMLEILAVELAAARLRLMK